jgi:hypothetical protein
MNDHHSAGYPATWDTDGSTGPSKANRHAKQVGHVGHTLVTVFSKKEPGQRYRLLTERPTLRIKIGNFQSESLQQSIFAITMSRATQGRHHQREIGDRCFSFSLFHQKTLRHCDEWR